MYHTESEGELESCFRVECFLVEGEKFVSRVKSSLEDGQESSWVVKRGVISPLIWVITIVTLRITPLITPHEPPSRAWGLVLL